MTKQNLSHKPTLPDNIHTFVTEPDDKSPAKLKSSRLPNLLIMRLILSLFRDNLDLIIWWGWIIISKVESHEGGGGEQEQEVL